MIKKFIASNPNILNGKLIVAGTRIPVAQILFLLKEGYSVNDIHEEYPNVPLIKIKGVIDELTTSLDNAQYGSAISQI